MGRHACPGVLPAPSGARRSPRARGHLRGMEGLASRSRRGAKAREVLPRRFAARAGCCGGMGAARFLPQRLARACGRDGSGGRRLSSGRISADGQVACRHRHHARARDDRQADVAPVGRRRHAEPTQCRGKDACRGSWFGAASDSWRGPRQQYGKARGLQQIGAGVSPGLTARPRRVSVRGLVNSLAGEWPGGASLVCFVRRSITPVTADPTNPPPPSGPEFPAPPGPGATRDEWRAWRDRQRDYVRSQWHSSDWYGGGSWPWFGGWGWFWGVALVVIGACYLLFKPGLL